MLKDFLKKFIHINPVQFGIVGINKRNIDFILEYNERKYYPMVDDKLITKKLALEAGIPTPNLLGVIHHYRGIDTVLDSIDARNGFVVKPCKGSGGGGIIVITRKQGDSFFKAEGKPFDRNELKYYISNILAGLHSLGGNNDVAIIEERIVSTDLFTPISYKGVPDLRIIVFKGYPVIAMLRLPTRQSDGKANLHSGGIGVGLSIRDGRTTFATQGTNYITHHPDTDIRLSEIEIPDWEHTLEIAAKFKEILPLGFLGIDLVLDKYKGAALLEANARPGLAVQIANRIGLEPRLRLIEKITKDGDIHPTPLERVHFARENFA